jgi:hypothetical protein
MPTGIDGRKARAAPAREFLRTLLAVGPVEQRIVVERGAEQGFSLPQLRRARENIGATTYKERGKPKDSPWLWSMQPPTNAMHEEPQSDGEEFAL